MEYAVGIDVIEIARVRKVLERHPERFLSRVYSPEEVAFCRGRVPELAARFGLHAFDCLNAGSSYLDAVL